MSQDNGLGAGLRRSGPIGRGQEEGVIQDFPTMAEPHPDTLAPTNELTKHIAGPIPKDNLGNRGFGGAAKGG